MSLPGFSRHQIGERFIDKYIHVDRLVEHWAYFIQTVKYIQFNYLDMYGHFILTVLQKSYSRHVVYL